MHVIQSRSCATYGLQPSACNLATYGLQHLDYFWSFVIIVIIIVDTTSSSILLLLLSPVHTAQWEDFCFDN